MTICLISLGCPKNVVDAEVMLGLLARAGHAVTDDVGEADMILVNTCGFIQSAKEEAIEAIFEAAAAKREGAKLVVTGCLAQRYPDQLLGEIPEVDAVLGIGEIGSVAADVEEIAAGARLNKTDKPFAFCSGAPRLVSTLGHTAYLKLADGCDNRCAYCAIPGIRGKYVSRPREELLREADALLAGGARELILIAQDTTRYGLDLYGRPRLADLLKDLSRREGEFWLRTLYCYPEMIDEALLDAMLGTKGACRYLDVPIQHISDDVLRAMNRRGGRAAIERMYRLARDRGFTLRTTVLVGFPGETDGQFAELMSFLRDHPFDRLGAFAYSKEEGTPAAASGGQVPARVKRAREREVMRMQQDISRELLKKRVGTTCRALIERIEEGRAVARSEAEAPEIDGEIILPPLSDALLGNFADVRVTDSSEYDLEGALL